MKIYLGIKFHEDNSNKEMVDGISEHLHSLGHETYCVTRDLENWGQKSFSEAELMQLTFNEIKNSDLVLIEFSEKGVGLGIEAGYAYSRGISVHVIAKQGSYISSTLKGIASRISFYESYCELNVN